MKGAARLSRVFLFVAPLEVEADTAVSRRSGFLLLFQDKFTSMQLKYDVFISYSRKNEEFANALHEALKLANLRIWMDQGGIEGGSRWEEEIRRGLGESRMVLLVLSQPSMESKWVKREVKLADNLGKEILPVQIEHLLPETSIPWCLDEIQRIDAQRDQSQRMLDKIVEATRKTLESLVPPVVDPVKPPLPPLPSKSLTLQHILTSRGRRETRLFNAVRDGATDVKATDKSGRTTLHYAAQELESDVVRLLLERGADPRACDQEGVTPLHRAVGDVDLARLLILKGANFEAKDKTGQTPLDYAQKLKPTLTTQTRNLLELFADIKRGTKTPNAALEDAFAMKSRQSDRILDAVAAGADDVKMRDAFGRTALHWAAQENEPELVELLLKRGADAHAFDIAKNTPAMLARKQGYIELESALHAYEQGLPVVEIQKPVVVKNTDDAPLSTSEANARLQAALRSGGRYKSDMIMRAIHGATDFSLVDKAGRTALHWAAMKGDLEAVNIALSHNADINATSTAGDTPLDLVRSDCAPEIIQLLTQDVEPPSATANQQLQAALISRSPSKYNLMMNALVEGATNFSLVDQAGRTVLHWAAMKADLEAVKHLVERGAELNIASNTGDTPLALARIAGSKRIVNLLVKNGAK